MSVFTYDLYWFNDFTVRGDTNGGGDQIKC